MNTENDHPMNDDGDVISAALQSSEPAPKASAALQQAILNDFDETVLISRRSGVGKVWASIVGVLDFQGRGYRRYAPFYASGMAMMTATFGVLMGVLTSNANAAQEWEALAYLDTTFETVFVNDDVDSVFSRDDAERSDRNGANVGEGL